MGSRFMDWVKNHPEDILTGISSLCTVGAVVTGGFDTIRAQKKMMALLEKNPDATRMDIFKTCAPCYIPSVIVAGTGVGTGIASRRMSARQIAELTTAGSALGIAAVKKYKNYREEVKSRYGEETEKDIHDAAEVRDMEDTARKVARDCPTGYDDPIRVFEEISGEWYTRTPAEIFDGIARSIERYAANGYSISAYELLIQLLGVAYKDLEPNDHYDTFGYSDYAGECVYGYTGIPFNVFTDQDEDGTFIHISYFVEPHTEFDGENYDKIDEMVFGGIDTLPDRINFGHKEYYREPYGTVLDEELPFQ